MPQFLIFTWKNIVIEGFLWFNKSNGWLSGKPRLKQNSFVVRFGAGQERYRSIGIIEIARLRAPLAPEGEVWVGTGKNEKNFFQNLNRKNCVYREASANSPFRGQG